MERAFKWHSKLALLSLGCINVSGVVRSTVNSVLTKLPWWCKIGAKLILSKFPLRYGFWGKVGLFRHGAMDEPEYAAGVFQKHLERVGRIPEGDYVALELGPGDSLVSALSAYYNGITKYYLVDAGHFASDNPEVYRHFLNKLQEANTLQKSFDEWKTVDELMWRVGASYMTEGLKSLKQITDNSVDFIWSQAVLEHIREQEFDETMQELRRILKPGGVASHRVDLKDHLGGALNNLRFSNRLWEKDWMASSGFYTNRIRYSDMIKRFNNAGFKVDIVEVSRWDEVPTPIEKLDKTYRSLPVDELCISGFDVILR